MSGGPWLCPTCRMVNPGNVRTCLRCRRSADEATATPAGRRRASFVGRGILLGTFAVATVAGLVVLGPWLFGGGPPGPSASPTASLATGPTDAPPTRSPSVAPGASPEASAAAGPSTTPLASRSAAPATTPAPTTAARRTRARVRELSLPAFAGYFVQGARTYTAVEMTWVQPNVTCDRVRPALMSVWVGIQDRTANLEQAGTVAFCLQGSGAAVHRAFYEMYPAPPRYFTLVVRPGDRMRARVVASGSTFTLSVWNLTTGKSASARQRKAVARTTAVWMVEAPSRAVDGDQYPLARFSPVTITAASATGDGRKRVIDDPAWRPTRVTMRSGSRVLATAGRLTADGRGFSVTWRHH